MLACLTILTAMVALAKGACTVNIESQLNADAPLLLLNNQLWAPNGDTLRMDAGDIIQIACPRRTIVNTGTVTADIQCVFDQTFNLGGILVDISSVSCANRPPHPMSSIQNTHQLCGNGGTLLNIGFVVPDFIPFVTYIQSCYNLQTNSAIYSRHVIRGQAINDKIVDRRKTSFRAGDIDTKFRDAYLQRSQQTRFRNLLGPVGGNRYFVTNAKFLARGHLAPDADGIFRPWQQASYYYVNAVPIWQKVNNCNWKAVENAAREMAARLREDVLIFTGVHDILTLPNDHGHQIPITLRVEGIEVPKWIWKIIKWPEMDAAMVLVTHNDPFRQDALPADELLCPDVCAQYGWTKENYRDSERGYTYCCTVASLLHVIPSIPPEAHSTNVLHFNTFN
ncbi:uncharacterized protein LOC126567539 [Anopheles maculipalpis]|uniref:uncharacterized protein LOC126567539 n=1 Tax=Anopheles maculipalpis TaxID=1496333 RepID=UPI00215943A6|nr:uncharacterized protein LOC126567539 [Anopheles maculipalpis]